MEKLELLKIKANNLSCLTFTGQMNTLARSFTKHVGVYRRNLLVETENISQ